MSEKEFQRWVVELAEWYRILTYHNPDSRRSNPGFPDLVLVGRYVVFAELKTDKGRVSEKQREWLTRLNAAGQKAYVWRPSDRTLITRILADMKP